MKRIDVARQRVRGFWKMGGLGLLTLLAGWPSLQPVQAHPNVVLWDTFARLGDQIDLTDRSQWKPVPAHITDLEKDPAKAASDPGYYGREYAFRGDAVFQSATLTAAFCSTRGTIALYSHPVQTANAAQPTPGSEKLLATLEPFPAGVQSAKISRYEVLRNANDELLLETTFTTSDGSEVSGSFSLGTDGILAVKPGPGMRHIRLVSPLEYGVAPSFIGDDLVISAPDEQDVKNLSVPANHMFLGLRTGEEQMLVLTWPSPDQRLQLGLGSAHEGKLPIESIEFDPSGHSLFLSALQAPGIWHKESLSSAYLEKDVPSEWKPPFPAAWKTELSEAGVIASFDFRETRGQVWRGVPGSYIYPVWLEDGHATYHLSKKIPPEGASVVYFLEGKETPPQVLTPADALKTTLGFDMADTILDPAGRRLRTHHRRAGEGVHRACTCGCTEAIQAVFEAGTEVEQKDYIDGALHDMIYFVQRHVGRIDEYQRFAYDLLQFLHAKETAMPEIKSYLESVAEIAEQIPQEYNVQKENTKSLPYADELARKTLRLADKKDPANLQAYMDLLKDWRAMGGAQDYVLADCHMLTRKLFQQAASGCLTTPAAVPVAQQILARCREVLRNPDGYEIWDNY